MSMEEQSGAGLLALLPRLLWSTAIIGVALATGIGEAAGAGIDPMDNGSCVAANEEPY